MMLLVLTLVTVALLLSTAHGLETPQCAQRDTILFLWNTEQDCNDFINEMASKVPDTTPRLTCFGLTGVTGFPSTQQFFMMHTQSSTTSDVWRGEFREAGFDVYVRYKLVAGDTRHGYMFDTLSSCQDTRADLMQFLDQASTAAPTTTEQGDSVIYTTLYSPICAVRDIYLFLWTSLEKCQDFLDAMASKVPDTTPRLTCFGLTGVTGFPSTQQFFMMHTQSSTTSDVWRGEFREAGFDVYVRYKLVAGDTRHGYMFDTLSSCQDTRADLVTFLGVDTFPPEESPESIPFLNLEMVDKSARADVNLVAHCLARGYAANLTSTTCTSMGPPGAPVCSSSETTESPPAAPPVAPATEGFGSGCPLNTFNDSSACAPCRSCQEDEFMASPCLQTQNRECRPLPPAQAPVSSSSSSSNNTATARVDQQGNLHLQSRGERDVFINGKSTRQMQARIGELERAVARMEQALESLFSDL